MFLVAFFKGSNYTGCWDSTILCYNVTTATFGPPLPAHSDAVRFVIFSLKVFYFVVTIRPSVRVPAASRSTSFYEIKLVKAMLKYTRKNRPDLEMLKLKNQCVHICTCQ